MADLLGRCDGNGLVQASDPWVLQRLVSGVSVLPLVLGKSRYKITAETREIVAHHDRCLLTYLRPESGSRITSAVERVLTTDQLVKSDAKAPHVYTL